MHRLVLPLSLLLLGAACVADVGEGRVAATVTEAAPVEAATTKAPGTILMIDPAQSSLKALGAKITATHPVDFLTWTGRVTVDGDTLTGLDFEAWIDSLMADAPKLTAHLKKEDFLDAATFPKATFVSTRIVPGGEAGATHTITGNLTIRGVTKGVTFPAKVAVTPDGISASTEFVIDRQDFGVAYPGRPDDLVQDNVVLTVTWVAPRV